MNTSRLDINTSNVLYLFLEVREMPIRYEGRVPKTLRNWIEKHAADKVYEVSASGGFSFENRNGFGYDVGIKPGWCVDYHGDRMHTCIEPTVRDVIDVLSTLERCEDDAECREAWGLK